MSSRFERRAPLPCRTPYAPRRIVVSSQRTVLRVFKTLEVRQDNSDRVFADRKVGARTLPTEFTAVVRDRRCVAMGPVDPSYQCDVVVFGKLLDTASSIVALSPSYDPGASPGIEISPGQ